jgi:hypothetical protein
MFFKRILSFLFFWRIKPVQKPQLQLAHDSVDLEEVDIDPLEFNIHVAYVDAREKAKADLIDAFREFAKVYDYEEDEKNIEDYLLGGELRKPSPKEIEKSNQLTAAFDKCVDLGVYKRPTMDESEGVSPIKAIEEEKVEIDKSTEENIVHLLRSESELAYSVARKQTSNEFPEMMA